MKPEIAPAAPALNSIANADFQLGGEIGRRLEALTRQWLLPAPLANPVILEMFRYRDRKPWRHMVPWAGEFAGKYLTHAVQIWRLTRDAALEAHLRTFVRELVTMQDEDGYLGPWPREFRFKLGAPNSPEIVWDAWGHYHITIGLLLWHEQTADAAALRCALAIADLLCDRFLGTDETLHGTGVQEINLAPIHSLALLHRSTGEARYLQLAQQIEREFEQPPAGDYLRLALEGREFWESPKPRWESLHPIMGLAELHYATGEEKYKTGLERLWWSMAKGDRHNSGGFTSGEKATGNPYDAGAIETCCTVAWMALSVEMLRITGDSKVADELELSTWNGGLGAISPSGRWVTYNTPMDGQREASAHTIVFQARAGGSELNCCSVNGPRILGLLSEWALMRSGTGLTLNYYGPGRLASQLASGLSVTLRQTTNYPFDPIVTIEVETEGSGPANFPLALRIPHWSAVTRVTINGARVPDVAAGQYLTLEREWQSGDFITLQFDFAPRFWVWRREEAAGVGVWLTSVYRGPILLALDPRFNAAAPEGDGHPPFPTLSAQMPLAPARAGHWLEPLMLLETAASDGTPIRLCDFASAGQDGGDYRSWLRVAFEQEPSNEFSPDNPLRTFQVP